ncbi:MAG: FAD-linked oxidase C-terminal domain-containing protein [Bacteroidales bacterium]|nr:FAD-linked oxidase C-terminal domain-containing protein [Bacteroidales bacterium]
MNQDISLLLSNLSLEGDVYCDEIYRNAYSTDASVYREKPLAVVCPKNKSDIQKLILFADENQISLIPRGAGTSLAGQVVGSGIVVDCSKYLNKILELNISEHWVIVEPGVVLEELNRFLKPYGWMFGPETSTASRCNIGGMVGNNSCGLHSLIWNSTREHTISINAYLSDGSEVEFKPLSDKEFQEKIQLNNLEGALYRQMQNMLSDATVRQEIEQQFPDARLTRRNHGYALDLMMQNEPFESNGQPFNFCKLLAGSEGTLAFSTAIKLHLIPLPEKCKGLVCVHVKNVLEACKANLLALQHHPSSVELMDDSILNLAKRNIEQRRNLFFVKDNPGAILMVEFFADNENTIREKADHLIDDLKRSNYGFYYPLVLGNDVQRVWNLRKAGLGILSNMPGDSRPVAVTEDTAVIPEFLPEYITDFEAMMQRFGLNCTYHAHIATGELHLRPVLNLKDKKDVELFRTVALETAILVKKYRGSISGEHGDGRLRGEFIPLMYGDFIYNKFIEIKNLWDPKSIFNPHKIIDTPSMNTSLRYHVGDPTRQIDTIFDFSEVGGIVRAVEKCNGAADCRKSKIIGGTLCPSFQATNEEKNVTRSRANMLREILTNNKKNNPFDSKELYEVLDLCLLCKACKSECPSGVDVAKMKMEFLQHYYDSHHAPLRSVIIANLPLLDSLGMIAPSLVNFFMNNKITGSVFKTMIGFSSKRSIPDFSKRTLRSSSKKLLKNTNNQSFPNGKVYLFVDEFSNFNDAEIGIKAIRLLTKLGYEVQIPTHTFSGRTWLSKGFLRKAKTLAVNNVIKLAPLISETTPLIGIEPSAILAFRDEYPDLVGASLKSKAENLAKNTLLFDEFVAKEIEKGKIKSSQFTEKEQNILFHGHCQQKALTTTKPTFSMLSLPKNYHVAEIPSGCCGMAGAFGYEKEHYEISQKVGELVLFPAIRDADKETMIVAAGTSCRHQILDATGRKAFHPIEILWDALNV